VVGFYEHDNEPSASIKKAAYFLTRWVTIGFSNDVLHHGVSKYKLWSFSCIFLHSPNTFTCSVTKRIACLCRSCEGCAQSSDLECKISQCQEVCCQFWWQLHGFQWCRWGDICCCQETGYKKQHTGCLIIVTKLCLWCIGFCSQGDI